MEVLLPVALKLFPGMLPSTFETANEKVRWYQTFNAFIVDIVIFYIYFMKTLQGETTFSSGLDGTENGYFFNLCTFPKAVQKNSSSQQRILASGIPY